MSWTDRVALVIPNGVLNNSSEVFDILDPDSGGASTFTVPLSADGNLPATHWGAYTTLQRSTLDALALSTTEFKAYLDQLASTRGKDQLASATAFKNSVEISAEGASFWDFISGLGLQRVVTPL